MTMSLLNTKANAASCREGCQVAAVTLILIDAESLLRALIGEGCSSRENVGNTSHAHYMLPIIGRARVLHSEVFLLEDSSLLF